MCIYLPYLCNESCLLGRRITVFTQDFTGSARKANGRFGSRFYSMTVLGRTPCWLLTVPPSIQIRSWAAFREAPELFGIMITLGVGPYTVGVKCNMVLEAILWFFSLDFKEIIHVYCSTSDWIRFWVAGHGWLVSWTLGYMLGDHDTHRGKRNSTQLPVSMRSK